MNYRIPSKHILTAALYGYVFTLDFYKSMSDPKNQGSNFKWSNFRLMNNDLVKHNLFMSFPDNVWKRYKKVLQEEAIRSANKLLEVLLPKE